MLMYQCLLERKNDNNTTTITTSWLEQEIAKLGTMVQVLPDDGKGFFEVKMVYSPGVSKDALKEKQIRDRNCFGSIENA